MHLVRAKALTNLNFSGYSLICASISLHQKHYKILTFQDTFSLGDASRSTEGTLKFQFFRIPSHLSIHLVILKALKNLNFSAYCLTCVSLSLRQMQSKLSTFQDTLSVSYGCRYSKRYSKI